MKREKIVSIGVVYFHIYGGVSEDDEVWIEQINSYCCFASEFYNRIKEILMETQEESEIVHVFGAVADNRKAEIIQELIKSGIRDNVNRIIDGKRIRKKDSSFDQYGNYFFKLIQEYFYSYEGHFPFGGSVNDGECTATFVYAGDIHDDRINRIANSMVELWMEKEEPIIYGKQLMIRSFFMRNFVDRKIIAAIPDREMDIWNLILEGGIKLSLDWELSYRKELLSYRDLGLFSISGIEEILLEPAYAFAKIYHPRGLCKEWQTIFLFLCAIQEDELDIITFSKLYDKFLTFVEENICCVEDVPAIISKEDGLGALMIEVQNIRKFLQGQEERVISKDLLQTLSSRYIYIPYIMDWFDMGRIMPKAFSRTELNYLLKLALDKDSVYERGKMWENVAAYVIEHVEGWKITGRRIRTSHQEIDISIVNVSYSHELWELGPYILVECKNWKKKVDIPVIRNVAYNSMMKGNKTAILFSTNGITEDARKEIQRLAVNHIYILDIEKSDLKNLFSNEDCVRLICNKWTKLHDSIRNELPI